MHWLAITTIAYFLVALEVILDKFLLTSKRVSHPAIYAFYSGLLSSFALMFFHFGFHPIEIGQALISFLAGMVFIYGILALFYAIEKNEASQVTPVVGAVIPIITFILSIFFLSERLMVEHVLGVVLLIVGGLAISINLFSLNEKRFFQGFKLSIVSGVLLAIAFTSFKYFYERDNFINVFIWTRIGLVLGAISLLIFPVWRKIILDSLKRKKTKKIGRTNYVSILMFVGNKILGGIGSILLNFAISIGSVTIVNALIALEYTFVFLLGVLFSLWFPAVFREKRDWRIVFQKVSAIVMITAGIVLVSLRTA